MCKVHHKSISARKNDPVIVQMVMDAATASAKEVESRQQSDLEKEIKQLSTAAAKRLRKVSAWPLYVSNPLWVLTYQLSSQSDKATEKKKSKAATTKMKTTRPLSEYEKLRQANVICNENKLKHLGLMEGTPLSVPEVNLDTHAAISDSSSGDSSSEDEEEIVEVLDLKHVGNKDRVQVLWSSGKREWTDYYNAYMDAPELVHAFRNKNKRKLFVGGDGNDSIEEGDGNDSIEEAMKPCEHERYEAGITYRQEENAAYFNPTNGELHGTKCASCKKQFVHMEPSDDKEIRPSFKAPAYACVNRETKKCFHIVCSQCFLCKSVNSTGRTSRRRNNKPLGGCSA